MNHPFTDCPPRLNQSFDAEKASGSSIWNNPITRRSFLKRSGAATVGLIATCQLAQQKLAAETITGPAYFSKVSSFEVNAVSGCSIAALASPNTGPAADGYNETWILSHSKWGKTFCCKGVYTTTPTLGMGNHVIVAAQAAGWVHGATSPVPHTSKLSLHGWIQAGCQFASNTDCKSRTPVFAEEIWSDSGIDDDLVGSGYTEWWKSAKVYLDITHFEKTADFYKIWGKVYLAFRLKERRTPSAFSLPLSPTYDHSYSHDYIWIEFEVEKV
jgi:hypothetical protein